MPHLLSGHGRCQTPDAALSDPSQQQERVLLHRDERSRAERPLRRVARRELDLPPRAEAARRQREDDRFRVRVEDEEERVAEERLAVCRPLLDLPTVEKDAERARVRIRPVALRHAPPVRPEPPRVRQPALAGLAAEEGRPPEDGMLASQRDDAARELEQLVVGALPVEPGDLVVLAPRVVVAALAPPELVAA